MQTNCTPPGPVPLAPQLYHPPGPYVNYQDSARPAVHRPPFSTPSYSAAGLHPRLLMAVGGEWAKVAMPKFGPPERRDWRRGSITTFSARSRSRMLQSFAKIDHRATDPDTIFVTLTYPDVYPQSVRRCKAHLEAWRKRVARQHPNAWFYWKLEFQVRGATHFHLLLFNPSIVDINWFHDIWFEIVNSGDEDHWAYGTDVRRCHTWKQAGSYCAKYTSKIVTEHICEGSGRFWGIATRKNRVETIIEAEITEGEFYAIRRWFRRIIGNRQTVGFHNTRSTGMWVRCNNGTTKRLLALATSSQDASYPERPAPEREGVFGGDTLQPCNDRNSTADLDGREQTKTDRIPGKPNYRLFDSLDGQAAWARRWN